MDSKIIDYNNNFYLIESDLFESSEIFYDRITYILNNLDKDTFENIVKKSRIYVNIKNFGCYYNI